jgi:hypothetical protein
MKKLLLTLAIIVLPLMGYGQNYEKLFKEADWVFYSNPDTLRPTNPPQPITLQDLIDYQEYCYNDSIATGIYAYNYDNAVWDSTYTELFGWTYVQRNVGSRRIYKHYQPTFSGFIEWLKNKEK